MVGAAVCWRHRAAPVRAVHDKWPVMGTVARLSFRAETRREEIRRTVQETYARLIGLMSAWDPDSELSRLSRAGCTNWTAAVSPEVAPCYRAALQLADWSGRAFNPAVGAALRAWGMTGGRTYADFDLGAIAKGFAVDEAWRRVKARAGDVPVLLDLGGNLRVVSGVWRTGIRNPFGEGFAAVVSLTNGEAVATSGHYERFVERDGVRYSHILDGRTGKPVTGMAGVTVIAPSAMWADGLSTTLFVLGPEDGARFLARHHPQAQALWIPDTPETPTLYATAALVPRLQSARWLVKTVSVETEE